MVDGENIADYNEILTSGITVQEYLSKLNATALEFIKENKRLHMLYDEMLFAIEATKMAVPIIMPVYNSRKILLIFTTYFAAYCIGLTVCNFITYFTIKFLRKNRHIMSPQTYRMQLKLIQLLIIQVNFSKI